LNWIGPDLRGRNLKELVAPQTPCFTPWSTSVSAERKQPGRYTRKANRPVSRDWNFSVHLDRQELDAAHQFYHDWVLAGLRSSKPVDSTGCAEVHEDSACGQVPKRDAYGAFDRHDCTITRAAFAGNLGAAGAGGMGVIATDARSHEGHDALSEADLRAMAQPRNGAEKSVEELVCEYLANGGTIKKCPAFMTRKGAVKRIVEWIVPQAPSRGVGVTDAPHAMPLNWFQAKHRRVWRWARNALCADEASLIERVVLRGEPTDAVPVLNAALRKLARHYQEFDPAEDLRNWESNVRRNLQDMGVAA
jgi:hypothetical protein